jgi:hypothetical protein
MTKCPKGLLTMTMLREALMDHLPRRPGYSTLRAACDAGMPSVPSGTGKSRLFILADVLKWWLNRRSPQPLLTSATDAALQASKTRRRSKTA